MQITLLGTGSATPLLGRHPSCITVSVGNEIFMIDCGEGTQWQLLTYGIKQSKINHIFISHLHGDHYLGLIGFICTLNSHDRTHPLHVYAPPGLKEIISVQLRYQDTRLQYYLHIHELNVQKPTLIFENNQTEIIAFPMRHRVITHGYLVKTKPRLRNIIKSALPPNILLQHIHLLKQGIDVVDENGNVLYAVDDYTTPVAPTKSFAYCSDTCYDEDLLPMLQGVDLLYHEATFLHEKIARAQETFHTTAWQAATLAKKAEVKSLLIGHFSSRYKHIEPLLEEAQAVFPATEYALEGKTIVL